MKQFIQNLCLFIIILIGFAIILDFGMTTFLRHTSMPVYSAWNAIYDDTTSYNMVVLGSSRGMNHYNPLIFDSILCVNSYNLGMKGMMLNQQIMRYHAYVRQKSKQPDVLIINIDYCAMDVISGYEKAQVYPYFWMDKQLRDDFDQYEHFGWEEKYIPGYRYLYKNSELWKSISQHVISREYTKLVKGHLPIYANWNGSVFATIDSIQYVQHPIAVSLFDDFIHELKHSGVQVVLVYSPVYYKATEKIVNLDGMYAMYDSIATKYDIPILDYNFDEICYDTICFANASHMNYRGANAFSIKLAHDIDSLQLYSSK